MKPQTAGTVLGALAVLMVAGCGDSHATVHLHHAAAAPATLTQGQGTSICNDLKAWLPGAFKQGMPRFNAKLAADETQAQGVPLGTDLSDLDSNLQSLNGLAFFPSPPGYTAGPQTGLGPLHQNCAAYGVNIPASPG